MKSWILRDFINCMQLSASLHKFKLTSAQYSIVMSEIKVKHPQLLKKMFVCSEFHL